MMRPFASTISLEEARHRLRDAIVPIARTERVRLADAAGKVAAGDVFSPMDVPPFARSAMDGYAVVATDTATASRAAPVRLRLIERIHTGQSPTKQIVSGKCAEIATGAPLPAGADAVVMVEDTAGAEDEQISIFAPVGAGQHVSPRGADILTGSAVLRDGELLTPSRVGAIAAIGCTELEVYAHPRVAILSTGNEVIEPGESIGPGQVFDVNRFTLSAVVAAHGGAPEPHAPVRDDLQALGAALERSLDADLVVFSGGSSVGERDLIVDVVATRGEMIFHGIAVKPGKPTGFARIAGKPFFAMPGNPTSCLSNAYILLIPFLRATARLPPFSPLMARVPLARRISSATGRHQFYTVRLSNGLAWPAFKASGDITSFSQADGYIEIPADQNGVEEGAVVDVTLF